MTQLLLEFMTEERVALQREPGAPPSEPLLLQPSGVGMHSHISRQHESILISRYVRGWMRRGYHQGIPDEAPLELEREGLAPSYRLICVALLKNDKTMQSLGFSRPPCELYNALKRDEWNRRRALHQGGLSLS